MRSCFFCISFVLFASSCATEAKHIVLKPSAVSKDFRDLDDDNPFKAKGANHVDYLQTEIKEYDAFFSDAAEVKGVVVLADVVLKETDAFIAKVKKEGGKKVLSEKQQKEFDRKQERLGKITDLLVDVPDRSGKLGKKSKSLADNVGKTFIGPNAFKVNLVVKGLEEAKDDLEAAGKRSPKLLEHAQKTTASMVGLE